MHLLVLTASKFLSPKTSQKKGCRSNSSVPSHLLGVEAAYGF